MAAVPRASETKRLQSRADFLDGGFARSTSRDFCSPLGLPGAIKIEHAGVIALSKRPTQR
jgi:hypothetical protein